jgi:hypothetical protein
LALLGFLGDLAFPPLRGLRDLPALKVSLPRPRLQSI